MKSSKIVRAAAAAAASAGLLVPQAPLYAEGSVPQAVQATAQTAAIGDVALSEGGILRGQVLDAQGFPLAETAVSIQAGGREVATSMTNSDGSFTVHSLRGGTYTVLAGQGAGAFRLWAPQTAPPAAKPGILIISGREIARGQRGQGGGMGGGLLMMGILGGIVAGGLISQENAHGPSS